MLEIYFTENAKIKVLLGIYFTENAGIMCDWGFISLNRPK